jgi:UrcA family protein
MKIALILMGATVLGADPANAQPIEIGSRQFELVQVTDLNLASGAGLETLDRRIRGAATRVCAIEGGRLETGLYRACFNAALIDARIQLDRILMARVSTSGTTTTLGLRN